MVFAYPSLLESYISNAYIRLQAELSEFSPFMADMFSRWTKDLAKGSLIHEYFMHPYSFPIILFPWWFERSLKDMPDEEFQKDITCSTMAGYFSIRLIDNIMDERGEREITILPVISFLHNRFQSIYCKYFPNDHHFWHFFDKIWTLSAESSLHDRMLEDIDSELFSGISSKKVCAGKIPIVGVGFRNNIKKIPQDWERLYDLMGMWHQMHNDLFDWKRDQEKGICTYFLSLAKKMKNENETVENWIIREGFIHGVNIMDLWMKDMFSIASHLEIKELEFYLDFRDREFRQKRNEIIKGLCMLNKIIEEVNR